MSVDSLSLLLLPRSSDRMTHREQSKGDCLVVDLSIDRSLAAWSTDSDRKPVKVACGNSVLCYHCRQFRSFRVNAIAKPRAFLPELFPADRFFHHVFSLVGVVDRINHSIQVQHWWHSLICDYFEKCILIWFFQICKLFTIFSMSFLIIVSVVAIATFE